MTRYDIVELAIKLKKVYKTTNPFKIAEMQGIHCDFVNFKKNVVQAYMLKPFVDVPPSIYINSNFDKKSQRILCAHELGHAILHKNAGNHFDGNSLLKSNEYEANLFAIALLYDPNSFIMDIRKMNNYILKCILDSNVNFY